jgi:glycosyltransferase involved in cell wall biosynthesis
MNNNELISVIIPLYNQGKFLNDAIQGLIKQSHQNWEAFIVNDGSTDDSGNVADSMAASDRRINVIHQVNAGVAAARNTGLRKTNGKYIALLDSDDYFLPSFFETMMQPLINNPDIDLSWSKPQVTNDKLIPIAPFYRKFGGIANFYTQQLLVKRPAYRLVWNNPTVPCGELWRAETIKSLMFSEERTLSSNEDWDLVCRLEKTGGKFHHVDGVHSLYRKHNSSANTRHHQLKSSSVQCAVNNYANSNDPWIAALSRLALTLSTANLNADDSLIRLIPGDASEDEDTIHKILRDDMLLPFATIWCGGAIRRSPHEPSDRAKKAIRLLKRKLPQKFITWEIAVTRMSERLQDYFTSHRRHQ